MSSQQDRSSSEIAAQPETAVLPRASRWPDALVAAGLAIIALVYLWPLRSALRLDPDEGILLQGAARILQGQLPYRDFFSFYTPGSYYWNAWLMKLFGESLLVPRTVLLLYGVLFSVLTFVLARRMASRTGAVVASLALLTCSLPLRFLVLHSWDTTAAALLALYCGLEFLRHPSLRWASGIGFFASLAVLFNQARGAGLVVGVVLGFLALRFLRPQDRLRSQHLLAMAAAFFLPLLATVVYFAAHGALNAMIQGLLWAPLHYTEANHLPYGFITMPIAKWVAMFDSGPLATRALNYFIISPIFVVCGLPIALVLIALSCAWKKRPDLDPDQVAAVIFSGAVVLGSLLGIAPRADFHHVTFITPLYFFLLPWAVERWAAPFAGLKKLAPLAGVYLLCAFTAYGLTLWLPLRELHVHQQTRRGAVQTLKKNEAIEFIQNHFPAGSTLLVHPYFPLYSFLTRTYSPFPYDYLQAGMHTPEQFEAALATLQAAPPRALLYEPDFVAKMPTAWPRMPMAKMVQDPVADFIVQNYRACAVFDHDTSASLLLMVRKDLSCSDYR